MGFTDCVRQREHYSPLHSEDIARTGEINQLSSSHLAKPWTTLQVIFVFLVTAGISVPAGVKIGARSRNLDDGFLGTSGLSFEWLGH
jgi:hypothetical protein